MNIRTFYMVFIVCVLALMASIYSEGVSAQDNLTPRTVVIRGGFGDEPSLPIPQPQRPRSKLVGELVDEQTGLSGAVIDGVGDSAAARNRMAQNAAAVRLQQSERWPEPVQPTENPQRLDKKWYSEGYFPLHENTNRVRLDAWTYRYGRGTDAFVLSCVYNVTARTGSDLQFFLKTGTPIHKFGMEVPVTLIIGKGREDKFELTGTVSTKYVGNLHIAIDQNTAPAMFRRMQSARTMRVQFQPVSTTRMYDVEYSLLGFTAASANTTTNCVDYL